MTSALKTTALFPLPSSLYLRVALKNKTNSLLKTLSVRHVYMLLNGLLPVSGSWSNSATQWLQHEL